MQWVVATIIILSGVVTAVGFYRRLNLYQDKWHTGRPATRWAFFEKFVISRRPGEPYLTRWRLIHTPWFGILLHKIDGPDPDQDPHDHPWNFISIVLRGGYTEQLTALIPLSSTKRIRATTFQSWNWLSVHKMPLGKYHKIVTLHKKPTWTLILTGPRKREWGFLTQDNGHIMWKTYLGLES